MVHEFVKAIYNSQITRIAMVDFGKAFDLVDHTIFFKKLKHYKLSDKTIN